MDKRPCILGVGGAMRDGSTSERALIVALKAAEAAGAEIVVFAGLELVLPMYSPSETTRTPQTLKFLAAIRRCHGLIISAPAYHGSISGMVKNALDYIEDLRTDDRPYLDGLAVGCIACAGGWQAAGQTLAALRSVAHALRGWPTPLGAMLNTSNNLFDPQGNCLDLSAKFQLETIGKQVVEFARVQELSRAALATSSHANDRLMQRHPIMR